MVGRIQMMLALITAFKAMQVRYRCGMLKAMLFLQVFLILASGGGVLFIRR